MSKFHYSEICTYQINVVLWIHYYLSKKIKLDSPFTMFKAQTFVGKKKFYNSSFKY